MTKDRVAIAVEEVLANFHNGDIRPRRGEMESLAKECDRLGLEQVAAQCRAVEDQVFLRVAR